MRAIEEYPVNFVEELISSKLMDLFIRVGLIAFLLLDSFSILKPFVRPILWSIILAIALYPLHIWFADRMGGKQGRAATALVLVILLCVLVPTTLLAMSFADSATEWVRQIRDGTFQVPIPPDSVAAWPLIGAKLHELWLSAHDNIGGVITKFEPKILFVSKHLLSYAGSVGAAMLKFLVSLVLAGVWMAYGAAGQAAARAIARKMIGPAKGDDLVKLCTSTIRAVAQGVIGIACIQALLLGIGFVLVGIPAAGILALLVLLLGIVQVPALLIVLPTIVYVFATNDSTAVGVMFAVYAVIAGAVDNVLKPLLLGRGVEAPMPVILLGALGGMATEGIIGLFLGAVMLALTYQLLMAWVYGDDAASSDGRTRRDVSVQPAVDRQD